MSLMSNTNTSKQLAERPTMPTAKDMEAVAEEAVTDQEKAMEGTRGGRHHGKDSIDTSYKNNNEWYMQAPS